MPKKKKKNKLKWTEKSNRQEVIDTEEMNVLWSIENACRAAEQKDAFDVFGNYIATKMRRLSRSVDQETIEIIEYEITNVIEKNRRKFWARSSYGSQIPPPPQLYSHPEQNITEKPHQPDCYQNRILREIEKIEILKTLSL